ncbi:DUF3347 domain-containing protein [Chitinophaga lutea]|uniref:DUF3347 domain-containing protein n=1 Tax=Chitinophaga lutea TaxID=2488634 RepID=A0A3N4PW69_9BACT|nr:DUF3347 domain-containing protein [Chitinophaga lutea]RPE08337.1 DUF3347 domain-containing protein [Chitinophaga lutea]
MIIRRFSGIILLAASLAACNQPQGADDAAGKAAAEQPLTAVTATLPAVYYDSLQVTMSAYYQLSAALVKADTMGADMAAAALKYHLDSLPVARTGLDSSRVAQLAGQASGISAELEGMLIDKNGLDGRRLAFQMVSDQLYDLLRVTPLKNTAIFRQYCPMAFDNRGAHWLSDKTEIVNPYFGDEMLHCGSVTDTLRF